ncbi:MAG: hypothetical protein FWE11_10845 [Defluviitaleaceae bacterium]|nr:hypothetical protein [Defluviitaleaceae bacterium]
MSLEFGAFIEISGCFRCPYNFESILSFIEQSDIRIDANGARYYKCDPNKATHDSLMNEECESLDSNSFNPIELRENVVASIDIIFNNSIPGRIYTSFFDDSSYGISILLSEEDLEFGKYDTKFLSRLADIFFKVFRPMYGHIGVEASVWGLESLQNDFLRAENTFILDEFYHQKKDAFELFARENGLIIRVIEGAGVIFEYGPNVVNGLYLNITNFISEVLR